MLYTPYPLLSTVSAITRTATSAQKAAKRIVRALGTSLVRRSGSFKEPLKVATRSATSAPMLPDNNVEGIMSQHERAWGWGNRRDCAHLVRKTSRETNVNQPTHWRLSPQSLPPRVVAASTTKATRRSTFTTSCGTVDKFVCVTRGALQGLSQPGHTLTWHVAVQPKSSVESRHRRPSQCNRRDCTALICCVCAVVGKRTATSPLPSPRGSAATGARVTD